MLVGVGGGRSHAALEHLAVLLEELEDVAPPLNLLPS